MQKVSLARPWCLALDLVPMQQAQQIVVPEFFEGAAFGVAQHIGHLGWAQHQDLTLQLPSGYVKIVNIDIYSYSEFSPKKRMIFHSYVNVYQRVY